jgi:endonuclease YncB( thermonuclease family)
MRAKGIAILAGIFAVLFASTNGPPTRAQTPQGEPKAPRFAIPRSGLAFVSGDTWIQNGQTMRLFGVQACIRGAFFTNAAGVRADCGEASLAYLAAMIRDTKPECEPLFQSGSASPVIFVVCQAHVGASMLDLGTIMIGQGFAFASFAKDGDAAKPVYMPYMVAELGAKQARAGLWASAFFPHPYATLTEGGK